MAVAQAYTSSNQKQLPIAPTSTGTSFRVGLFNEYATHSKDKLVYSSPRKGSHIFRREDSLSNDTSVGPLRRSNQRYQVRFVHGHDHTVLSSWTMADPHASKVRDLVNTFLSAELPPEYAELELLADSALQSMQSRSECDIERWACQLAKDVSEAGD